MKYLKLASFLVIVLLGKSVLAATYYVKPGGSDSADGKSHATAWKTIGKVNSHSFKTGDDVYFLAGGSWKLEKLQIDWSGTATNRVIVGAYFMNNSGNETPGVPSGTGKPRIIGSYTGKCPGTVVGSCIDVKSAVPSGVWTGLVGISGNYVTLRNMRVQNSAGRGIVVNNDYSYAILENNEVYYTAANSTIFNRGSSHNIFRNNDTSYCAMGWRHGDWKKIAKHWPTCNSAVTSNYNIFEGNYVHESYGEGIVMLKDAQYNIIRDNKIVAVRSANIYLDNSSNNIVENNIMVGDRDGEFTHGKAADGHKYGGGLTIRVEGYNNATDAVNNIVRNNLLVRSGGIVMSIFENAKVQGRKVGGKIFNNTLIETRKYLALNEGSEFYGPTEIANNIFFGAPLADGACTITPTGINVHHNHWSHVQKNAKCNDGSGDIVGNPKLSRTDWKAVGVGKIPKPNDFKPKADSSVIGQASKQTAQVFTKGFSHSVNLTGNCTLDLTEVSQDFFCGSRIAQNDMGAINVNSVSATSNVVPPVGLSMTIITSTN